MQQDFLENIISLMPGHVYWLDKNNIFLGCNDVQARDLGLKSRKDIVGKTPYDFIARERADALVKSNKEVMRSGKLTVIEETFNLPDGREVIYLSQKRPLMQDGKVVGILGVSTDITQQKEIERQLKIAQAEVQEAGSYLENIIALMPGHVYWKDKNGAMLGCNELQAKSAGYSRKTIIGLTDYELPWKDQAALLRSNDLMVMRTKKSHTVEEPLLLKSGKEAMFLSRKAPLKNSNGNIIGILGISIDITKQKLMEQELLDAKQQAERVRDYLENIIGFMPGNIYWKNRDGVFLGCNKNTLKVLGLKSAAQLIGKNDYDFLPKEMADYIVAFDKKVMQKGKAISVEISGLGKWSRPATYITNISPLRDGEHKIIGVMGVSFDITRRKRKELKLQQARESAKVADKLKDRFFARLTQEVTGQISDEERTAEEYAKDMRDYLENIIALMPGHVYWKDVHGNYLGCNDNQAKALGLRSRKNIVGKPAYAKLPRKLAERLRSIDNQVLKSGKAIILEEPGVLCGGGEGVFLTHKVPLSDGHGKVIGLLGVSLDITQRKKAEQGLLEAKLKEEKLENMVTFGASIAHELRTPIRAIESGIGGIKHYLADLIVAYHAATEANLDVPFVPKKRQEFLSVVMDNIMAETRAAFTIIDMLLMKTKASEVDAENFHLCSMAECVDMALQRYPFKTNEKNLVTWNADNNFFFQGEELLMTHVLFNLLKNALYFIKAADKGSISIWLEKGHKTNALHFKDTGAGISAKVLPNIFERFFSNTPHGYGVGLAFCKLVMQGFQGDITCRSKKGKFTEFILTFPKKRERKK